MSITLEQIEHLEELARIHLIPKERKLYAKQLSSVLDYVNKLQEVDVEGVEPTGHASERKNILRDDEAIDCPVAEVERILENAPDIKDGLFKVKSVFEKK